ncbi:MAG: hypothetical protein M3536_10165 [Actinomycetota bacterium]|nr:hypothetical protein [Actinomycetota bacterium]
MSYYLQDNPNPNFAQFGWPRAKVSGVIGVHTTESGVIPNGPDGGAENTAGYIRRRLDAGGYHSLADADSRLKLVHPRYAAWADITNNAHAMSVSGAMNAARWRDLSPERAAAIVRNMAYAAAELVQDALAAGLLSSPTPAVRISAAEAISGSRPGFYGHGETNPGTRYDPGQNFDWDLFLSTYAAAIGGGIAFHSSTPSEEDDMFTDDDRAVLNSANIRAEVAMNEATNAKNYALAAFQANAGLLQTRLIDPNNPDGYQPSLAEWIVYGNLKAGGAQQVASALTPELIAAAVAKASAGVDAQAIADRLTISVKR